MRPMLRLVPIVSALMLAACNDSRDRLAADAAAARSRPALGRVDTALTAPCPDPVPLPARALTQAEVETLWRTDRKNLVFCKNKHSGVIQVYRSREAIFAGPAPSSHGRR